MNAKAQIPKQGIKRNLNKNKSKEILEKTGNSNKGWLEMEDQNRGKANHKKKLKGRRKKWKEYKAKKWKRPKNKEKLKRGEQPK